MKIIKTVFMIIAAVLFMGCTRRSSINIEEIDYPGGTDDMGSLKDIYEYEFESTYTDEQVAVIKKIRNYDMPYKAFIRLYWEMFGTAQCGIDSNGNIWLNLQEDGYIVNRILDMKFGFYETAFLKLGNEYDWRIFSSPDGTARIIRVIDKKEGKMSIEWQEIDGLRYCIAKDIDAADYDLECVWSGNGRKAFLRLLPNAVYAEKRIEEWQYVKGNAILSIPDEDKILIKNLNYNDIWMITREEGFLRSRIICTLEESTNLMPDIKSDYYGEKLILYMGDCYENVMLDSVKKVRHTAAYLYEISGGEWAYTEILHFSSKLNYADVEFSKDGIAAVTDNGKLNIWNVKEGKLSSSETVIDTDYTACLYVENEAGRYIYIGTDKDIIRYSSDTDGVWTAESLYISPQNGKVVSMQYDRENEGLLIMYAIGESPYNTQKFKAVYLQLFTIQG